MRHKCISPFHVTHHGCHLKNNLGSLCYEHIQRCKTWWWRWTYRWKCTPSHNSLSGRIGTLVPTTNKTFLCFLKHKVGFKGQDQSKREKENLHKVAKFIILFPMDVNVGGNLKHETHILKVPFLIIHCIDPQCNWECCILGGKFYIFHIR